MEACQAKHADFNIIKTRTVMKFSFLEGKMP
jgi:hypothetical protein